MTAHALDSGAHLLKIGDVGTNSEGGASGVLDFKSGEVQLGLASGEQSNARAGACESDGQPFPDPSASACYQNARVLQFVQAGESFQLKVVQMALFVRRSTFYVRGLGVRGSSFVVRGWRFCRSTFGVRRSALVVTVCALGDSGGCVLTMEVFFQAHPELPGRVAGQTFGGGRRYTDFDLGLTPVFLHNVRPAQELGHLDGTSARVLHVAFEDHYKLVGQPTRGDIAGADLSVEAGGELFEHLISTLPAERLVEKSEIVDIEEQDTKLLASADAQVDLALNLAPVR
jgi:hypothetical protein